MLYEQLQNAVQTTAQCCTNKCTMLYKQMHTLYEQMHTLYEQMHNAL